MIFFVIFLVYLCFCSEIPFGEDENVVIENFGRFGNEKILTQEKIDGLISGKYQTEDLESYRDIYKSIRIRRNLGEEDKRGPDSESIPVGDSQNSAPFKYGGKVYSSIYLNSIQEVYTIECSGTVVGHNKILTAAHCVVLSNGTLFPETLFFPNFDGLSTSANVYAGIRVALYSSYKTSRTKWRDIAIVELDDSPRIGSVKLNDLVGGQAKIGIVDVVDGQEQCQLGIGDDVVSMGFPSNADEQFDGNSHIKTTTTVWFGSLFWGNSNDEKNRMFALPSSMGKGSSGGGVFKKSDPNVLCGVNVMHVKVEEYWKYSYIVTPSFRSSLVLSLLKMQNA